MGNSTIKKLPGGWSGLEFTKTLYTIYIHNFTEKKAEVVQGVPRSLIIFERQILPQQTIYRWKGNLTASRIHFKYWKNVLISRFYEQFSRNDPAMAPEQLFKKISNF